MSRHVDGSRLEVVRGHDLVDVPGLLRGHGIGEVPAQDLVVGRGQKSVPRQLQDERRELNADGRFVEPDLDRSITDEDIVGREQEKRSGSNGVTRAAHDDGNRSLEEFQRELQAGHERAWREVYSYSSIIRRLGAARTQIPIAIMANLGYRYYAHHLETHYTCDWPFGFRKAA